jgi:hypothetical protein
MFIIAAQKLNSDCGSCSLILAVTRETNSCADFIAFFVSVIDTFSFHGS